MKKLPITLPVALCALAVWLALTLGGGWLAAGGRQHSLAESVGGAIGWHWALAAAFALAMALASSDRHAAGLGAPASLRSARLIWLPLLYTVLMLFIAWAGDLPARSVVLVVACNAALVALSEELMFRAVLLQGFLDRYAVWPAVLGSSAVFGVVHAANGFASGDRLRTRSVWPMVVVHGLWDFALVTSVLSATAQGETSVLPYAALVAVLPLCLYGLYLLRGLRGQAAPEALAHAE